MAEEIHYRILAPSTGEFRDRGSKFFAHAFPVRTQQEIEAHLAALKKQYYDARHHCYAYRLGVAGETSFANDDGEPSHTAGDPILGVIRSECLTDVFVVVVRYFGGIKLGVRGLIEAYRAAAVAALGEQEKEAIIPRSIFRLDFSYEQTSDVSRLLHPFPLTQVDARYLEACSIDYAADLETYPRVIKVLEDHGYSPVFLKEVY
ncbi:MAG: YigZ family protein [Bacteroidia bacterium]|nr:YigZ family protein [Bacteroidia bacterium]